ncbi:MAG: hypothetical protein NTX72_02610 [Candidatus Uhrbacteria bacterium]|nr:hypothetical protein [Candidatus Uhrbacteria bacterium]
MTEGDIQALVEGFRQDHWATLPDWQAVTVGHKVYVRVSPQFQESRWALLECTLDELIPEGKDFHARLTFRFEGGTSMTLHVVKILRHEKKLGIVANPDNMEMNGGAISNSPDDENLMFVVHQFTYPED